MATICDLDLQTDSDTRVKLIRWDSIHGNDVIFYINRNGLIEKRVGVDEDGEEELVDVNLFYELRDILKDI